MLADAGHVDRVVAPGFVDAADGGLRLDDARVGLVDLQRMVPLERLDVLAPVAGIGLDAGAALVGRLEQLADDDLGVPDDRHVRAAVLANLGGVDVDVDDLRVRREAGEVAGDPIVKARAERHQQIGLLEGLDGRVVAVHAGHAHGQLVGLGERAARHQRGDDGDAQLDRERAQFLGRVGPHDAATGIDDGPARHGDEVERLADHLAVATDRRLVAGQLHLLGPVPVARLVEDVLGDVDQHGAGAAGRGDVERLLDGAGDPLDGGHELVVLGDRHRDARDVRLLEGIRTDGGRGDLSRDGQHRNRVHHRVTQPGDQVRGGGTRGDDADTDATGGVGVPLRHVDGALLVANEDVMEFRIDQRVVGRENRPTRIAEDRVDAELLEGSHHGLCTSDLHDLPPPGSPVGLGCAGDRAGHPIRAIRALPTVGIHGSLARWGADDG